MSKGKNKQKKKISKEKNKQKKKISKEKNKQKKKINKRKKASSILNIPELLLYIPPEDFDFFITKPKINEIVGQYSKEDSNLAKLLHHSLNLVDYDDNDTSKVDVIMRKNSIKASKKVLTLPQNANAIKTDNLALYLGVRVDSIGASISKLIQSVIEKKDPERKLLNQIYFLDGDYLEIEGNDCRGEINGKKIESKEDIEKLLLFLDKLTIARIKAVNQIEQENLQLSSIGDRKTAWKGKNVQELRKNAYSPEVLDFLLERGLLTKLLEDGDIRKDILVKYLSNEYSKPEHERLMNVLIQYGFVTDADILQSVYGKKNFEEVVEDENTSQSTRFWLYAFGKISLETLKNTTYIDLKTALELYAYYKYPVEKLEEISQAITLETKSEEETAGLIEMFADAYKAKNRDETITGLSALLTHDILGYETSKKLLDGLQEKKVISEADNKFLEDLMLEFKINWIINNSENEILALNGNNDKVHYKSELTIDPKIRLNYLISLGTVKRIRIKGETFTDSKGKSGKVNSMDGYELFVIPSMRIAVLEKLYETTRDKDGNLVYKSDQGELKPAVNNATYLIPIGKAIDNITNTVELARTKNKRQLIDLTKEHYVGRATHTATWIKQIDDQIYLLTGKRPEAKLTGYWKEQVEEDHRKRKREKEKRELSQKGGITL